MEPYIKACNALLLQNHGAVTFGSSINDAYYKMEKLEHIAKTLLAARLLGGEKNIPEQKLKQLYEIAESAYNLKPNSKY